MPSPAASPSARGRRGVEGEGMTVGGEGPGGGQSTVGSPSTPEDLWRGGGETPATPLIPLAPLKGADVLGGGSEGMILELTGLQGLWGHSLTHRGGRSRFYFFY
jgi:hypothetical protein